MEQAGRLLTVADTAALLERSTEQVRRYLREGVLPGRRIGGQWFIDPGDAEQFLKQRKEGSDFASRMATSDADPLGAVIGLGGSGGADIGSGRRAYLHDLAVKRS